MPDFCLPTWATDGGHFLVAAIARRNDRAHKGLAQFSGSFVEVSPIMSYEVMF